MTDTFSSAHAPARSRLKWRPFWLACHLYLGLTLGLILALTGLTGSLLVFYVELDELINPDIQIRETESVRQVSYEAIFQALHRTHPERIKSWRLEIPRHPQAPMMARYYRPDETKHLQFAPLIAWINPYTAEVLSSRFWGRFVMTWIYDLHYQLLLDLSGKTVMAVIGGLSLISLATGLYLWWPPLSKIKSALSIKFGAGWKRRIYDWHKVSGVYGLLFLLILSVTGTLLELPDFFNPAIAKLSPLYQSPSIASDDRSSLPRISLDRAAAIAQTIFPEGQLRWLETPSGPQGIYRVQLYQNGEPSRRFPKSTVWIDQYSGKVLAVRDPYAQSGGDLFLSWLHPLHSGEVAGLFGRLLVMLAGLVPITLYITGFIRWRQKLKAKTKRFSIKGRHHVDKRRTQRILSIAFNIAFISCWAGSHHLSVIPA